MGGIAGLGWQLVSQLIRQCRFVDALDAGREAAAASVVQRLLHDRGDPPSVLGVDPSEILLREANDEQRLQVDLMAVDRAGTGVAFGLALLGLNDLQLAEKKAVDVIEFCQSAATGAEDPSLWTCLAEVFSATYIESLPYQEMNRRANHSAQAGDTLLFIIGHLSTSLHPGVSLATSAITQVMIMPHVDRLLLDKTSLYRLAVTPFILQFWQKAISSRPFDFRAPRMIREALDAAGHSPDHLRTKAVLKAVVSGLNVHFPPEAGEGKRWLYG